MKNTIVPIVVIAAILLIVFNWQKLKAQFFPTAAAPATGPDVATTTASGAAQNAVANPPATGNTPREN